MKTIQNFLQAFLLLTTLVAAIQTGYAQCTVRPVVKNTCHKSTDGSITLQVQGMAPYQFQWSNGSQDQNLDNLPEGTYAVSVTDAKGSKANHSIRVTSYQALEIKSIIEGKRVTAQVAGGKAPYIYHWIALSSSEKNTTNQATVQLREGNYLLLVEDGNGCSESHKFRIN